MTPRIENRTYSYQGDNICTVSATLNIYVTGVVVATTALSASYNIAAEDFVAEVTRQLNAQVTAYLGKLMELDALRQTLFPTSVDFASAVDLIFDPIQAAIGGA